LIFKNQGKNSPKQETKVFLETTVHILGGGESRKPTKNQREIQGRLKSSVLVGFLCQKKDCEYTLCMPTKKTNFGSCDYSKPKGRYGINNSK
jgi:hypothetical protein